MRPDVSFVVYAYAKCPDGALNLIDRRMFATENQARVYYDQKKNEIIKGQEPVATSLELNREIYTDNDWFMSNSENVEKYTRQFDFAAS